LVLPGFNLYEALKIDDPKKLAWKEHYFDLRGRHLEQAVLNGADLTKADLYGAQLQGASLFAARLQGASFVGIAIKASDFSSALLWRTLWRTDWWQAPMPTKIGVVLRDATWTPVRRMEVGFDLIPWNAKAYADLRLSMNSIPEGNLRDAALERIEILDWPTRTRLWPHAIPPPRRRLRFWICKRS
jgi:Pentapeptide repeats (8 copies)